jgi:GNAT superfamily N-acetyltransferase
MLVRSLDVLDLPLLSHYHRDLLSLDSARILTRGNPLSAVALLSYLDLRHHIYTAVANDDGISLMGQVTLHEVDTSARLTFLAPKENINGLTRPLLEHLVTQAGEWGAFHLLAEVDEESPAFRLLRQAGFAMYAWQRTWKLSHSELVNAKKDIWRPATEMDWPAVQSLYGQIVPALLHPVEVLPKQVIGLVCRPEGNLQAYVSVNSGPKGIWIQPIVPPDSECVSEQLASLAYALAGGRERPIYVCVRSYQAWLESILADLGALAGPRQAVMVKRLAKLQKVEEKISAMDKVLVKPTAPVVRVVINQDIPPKE